MRKGEKDGQDDRGNGHGKQQAQGSTPKDTSFEDGRQGEGEGGQQVNVGQQQADNNSGLECCKQDNQASLVVT